MSKSTFDFSRFKKVESNDDYSVLKNDDGHEIKIAHSSLSKQFQRELNKLPLHLAEGGIIPNPIAEVSELENDDEIFKTEEPMATGINDPMQLGADVPISQNEVMQSTQFMEGVDPNAPGGVVTLAPEDLPPVSIDELRQAYPGVDEGMLQQIAAQGGAAPTAPMATEQALTPVGGEMASAPMPQEPMIQNPLSAGDLQLAGIQGETQAKSALAQEQARILDRQIATQQSAHNNFQNELKTIQSESDALMRDIKESKVDPNQYMGNMSTGAKIAAAVGIIMGGVGQAFIGGENLALKALNDNIQNDIKAQQANLGKKESLLAANMKRYNNLKDAYDATSIQMGKMAALQLEAATQKATSPVIQAQGMQALGKMQADLDEKEKQLAVRRMAANLMSGGSSAPSGAQLASGGGVNPDDLPAVIASVYELDPKQGKELQERFIPGIGIASTKKDADHLKEVNASATKTTSMINDLLDLADKPGASTSIEDRGKAQTLSTLLVGALNKQVTGGGPMSEKEQELVRSIAADPTRIFSLDAANRAALNTLRDNTQLWLETEASARGVNYNRERSLSPQQKSFLDWARRNPDNPMAKDVFKKLGMQ